jgi:hypothetical protein
MASQGDSRLREGIRRGAVNTILLNLLLLGLWVGVAITGYQKEGGTGSATATFVVLGFFALIDVGFIIQAISHLRRPESHPVYAGLLKRLGISLEELSGRVSAELAACEPGSVFGGLHILPSWLYRRGPFREVLIPIDEIAWVHKKETKTKRAVVITVRTTYQLVVHTLERPYNDTPFEVTASSRVVDAFLQTAYQRLPWIIVGYSKELERNWKHNRPAMLTTIVERRASAQSGARAASAS